MGRFENPLSTLGTFISTYVSNSCTQTIKKFDIDGNATNNSNIVLSDHIYKQNLYKKDLKRTV